jgi:hypothetical protein
MFDTVHTGTRHGQTKAFGKTLADLVPGDRVQLWPCPRTEAQHQAELRGKTGPAPVGTFAVAMFDGGFVLVRDGVLTDWVEQLPEGYPLFSSHGWPIEPEEVQEPQRPREVDPGQGARLLAEALGLDPDQAGYDEPPCRVCEQLKQRT